MLEAMTVVDFPEKNPWRRATTFTPSPPYRAEDLTPSGIASVEPTPLPCQCRCVAANPLKGRRETDGFRLCWTVGLERLHWTFTLGSAFPSLIRQ